MAGGKYSNYKRRKTTQKKVTTQAVKSMITQRTDWSYEPAEWVSAYSGMEHVGRLRLTPLLTEKGQTIIKQIKFRFMTARFDEIFRIIVVQDKGGVLTSTYQTDGVFDTEIDEILTLTGTGTQMLTSLIDPYNRNFNILLDKTILADGNGNGAPQLKEYTFNKLLNLKRNPVTNNGTGHVYAFCITQTGSTTSIIGQALCKYSS